MSSTPSGRRSSRWPRRTSASSSQKQKADNQLLVNDGETAVIGGLTVTEVTKTRSGIPLLSQPADHRQAVQLHQQHGKPADLIILVTPRIIDDSVSAQ